MGILSGSRCYLAGPVEHDGSCFGWRYKLTKVLSEMGIKVYNPLNKPEWYCEASKQDPSIYLKVINGGHSIGGIDEEIVFKASREMRDADLRLVSVMDFIICYHPKRLTFGTIDEVIKMHNDGKPVFYCCPDGILSTWLLVAASDVDNYREIFFNDWESLIGHIKKIDNCEISIDERLWPGLTWPIE